MIILCVNFDSFVKLYDTKSILKNETEHCDHIAQVYG